MLSLVPANASRAEVSDHALRPLAKSLEAFGGRDRLMSVKAVRFEEKMLNFEPFQGLESRGAPRHVSSEHSHARWHPASGDFQIERSLETYQPKLERRRYQVMHHGGRGLLVGSDGHIPLSDKTALTAARAKAEQKQFWITNPGLLMAYAFDSAVRIDDRMFGGRLYPTFQLDHADAKWIIVINPDNHFPWLLETQEIDPQLGIVHHTYRMGAWTTVDGAVFPRKLGQYLIPAAREASTRHDEFIIRRVLRQDFQIWTDEGDAPPPIGSPDIPVKDLVKLAEPDHAHRGTEQAHFFLRQANRAEPIDDDRSKITLVEQATGVFRVAGTRYHSLLVVGPASLALVNAPVNAERTQSLIDEAAARWPDKPIRHLILSHHHATDTGGLRPLIKSGVQVMLPKADLPFFQEIFGQLTETPNIVTVWQKGRLPGFGRELFVYDVPNATVYDLLITHIPDAKIVFSPLLYQPGSEDQDFQSVRTLLGAIDFYGPETELLVTGRGTGSVSIDDVRASVDRSQ
jgi:hypothetical protein